MSRPLVWASLAVVVLVGLSLVLGSYARYILTMWMIFAIATTGLNIPMGLSNLYSFGHGGFMLIGAYVTGIGVANWGLPFWAAMALSIVCAAFVGALVGLPSLRLTGFSLGIVTFALGMVLFQTVKAFEYTGGPQGVFLPGVEQSAWLGGRFFYYLALALLVLGQLAAFSIASSKTGRALRTLGSSEIVATSLGVHLLRYKVLAFVLSAVYGAVAGSLLALTTGYVAPETYSPELSVELFAAVMIGGSGTQVGPLLGALFTVLIPEVTQGARGMGQILYALLFCVIATLFPAGLAGMIQAAWRTAAAGRREKVGRA
ncbi:MAG: branched-chain amino acid ABC transporter permease [Lautropia sp.]